jgi:hypothetical protein
MGAGWRAVRQFHQRVEQEVRETIPDLPSSGEIARMARSPVAFLNQLADLPGVDTPVPDPAAEPEHAHGTWPADSAAPDRRDPPPADRRPGGAGVVPADRPVRVVDGNGPITADPSMN